MNSFSCGLLFKEIPRLFTNTRVPRDRACGALYLHVDNDSLPRPTYVHLRGHEGFGWGLCLCTPYSALFCALTYWKKNKVSKLYSVRKCAKSHLQSKIILSVLSKQLLPRGPVVSVGFLPFCLPSCVLCRHLRQAAVPPAGQASFLTRGSQVGRAWLRVKDACGFLKMERVAPEYDSARRQRGLSG